MIHTELLKLDAPYQVIYCGGEVGLHVATLIVVDERRDAEGRYLGIETHSHPVVSYVGKREEKAKSLTLSTAPYILDGAEGVVWNRAELRDTMHLCMEGDEVVDLKRINDILSSELGTKELPTLLRIAGDLKNLGIKINVPPREVMEQPKTLVFCAAGNVYKEGRPYVYVMSEEVVFFAWWDDAVTMAVELNTQQFAYGQLYPKENRPRFTFCIDKEETYADLYTSEDGTLDEQYEAIDPEVKARMEKLVELLNNPETLYPF